MKTGSQKGLSLLEIMIVLAIGMVLMAMVAPLVSTTLNMYRLRGASSDYANLLQTARMRAVTDDKYYNVINVIGNLNPGTSMNAYVNTGTTNTGGPQPGPAQAYVTGDPGVAFNHVIVIRDPNTAPGLANLKAQFLPAGANVQINPATTPWGPTFGSRGLPCQPNAATGGSCSYTFPVAGGQLPIAFEVFMQNTRTGIWEAVTVNPAGRVRQWHYNAPTGSWQPLN